LKLPGETTQGSGGMDQQDESCWLSDKRFGKQMAGTRIKTRASLQKKMVEHVYNFVRLTELLLFFHGLNPNELVVSHIMFTLIWGTFPF